MKNPTVSVIIPTYNRAHLVGRAINSVLLQTYKDFELIIVDDDSTDNTKQIIKSFEDIRIIYIKHKENKGGSAARNTGIKNAKGKYLAFLDSDDEWLSEKLDRQISLFKKTSSSVGLVYCLHYVKSEGINYKFKPEFGKFKRGEVYNDFLSGWCPSITSCAMLLAVVFKEVGFFDERFTSFQDYDMWIRVAKRFEFDYIENLLVINHQHSGSRVATDLEPRMEGLELFLDKWGDVIKNEVGEQAFNNIRINHLSIIYCNAAREKLLLYNYKEAFKYIKKRIKMGNIPLVFILRIIVIIIGGPRLLHRIKLIKFKILEKIRKGKFIKVD